MDEASERRSVGFALLGCLLLSGCSVFSTPPTAEPQRKAFTFDLRIEPGLDIAGLALSDGQTCTVFLREYPTCLKHEIRHCIEGDWHGSEPNGEDCD